MKMLVIEDEAHVVSIIQRTLIEAGYEVSVAMDGNSGYQMARSNAFNLLIQDIMMPGMNGLEVCKNLDQKSFPLASRCLQPLTLWVVNLTSCP